MAVPGARVTALRLALALQIVVVLYLALTSRPPPALDLGWDKLNHLTAFSVMAFTGILGFASRGRLVGAGLLAYGMLIEWLQSMTPDRQAQWQDVLADAVGIAIGLVIGRWVIGRLGKSLQIR